MEELDLCGHRWEVFPIDLEGLVDFFEGLKIFALLEGISGEAIPDLGEMRISCSGFVEEFSGGGKVFDGGEICGRSGEKEGSVLRREGSEACAEWGKIVEIPRVLGSSLESHS